MCVLDDKKQKRESVLIGTRHCTHLDRPVLCPLAFHFHPPMVRRIDTITIDSDDDDDDNEDDIDVQEEGDRIVIELSKNSKRRAIDDDGGGEGGEDGYNVVVVPRATSATSVSTVANSSKRKRTTMASSLPPPLWEADVVAVGEERDTMTTTTTTTTTTMTSPRNDGGDGKATANDDAGGRSAMTTLERPDASSVPSRPSIQDAADGMIVDEDAEFDRAIRLSLEEAERDGARRASYGDGDVLLGEEDVPPCRVLSRDEFKAEVDEWMRRNGGYDGIEGGQIIKHGNANDMNRSCVADGGGMYQTSAEYGRYSICGMFRVFDVLEGKADVGMPDSGGDITSGGDMDRRLVGPAGAKMTAFVDIGHGIGIQVLQAGWSHGIPARGVEIMKGRHLVAEALLQGVLDGLRYDPPNWDGVKLRNADFSHAVAPDACGRIDEELRRFLLFEDESSDVRGGLVIFVNNAEEVFGSRSNQDAKWQDLDSYLARLFASMEIGGRLVTLQDISLHLTRETEWFRRDVFESGYDAVSWNGNKSVNLYVLTKMKNHWFCQNPTCEYKNFDEGGVFPKNGGELNGICEYCNGPMTEFNEHSLCCRNEDCPCKGNAPIEVVDARTCELIEKCAWCDKEAKRRPRLRNPTAKASKSAAANVQSRKNNQKRKGEDDSTA